MRIKRNAKRIFPLLIAFSMGLAVFLNAAEAGVVYAEPLEKQDSRQDGLDETMLLVTEVYEKAGAYLAELKPGTGQIGGEWLVIGLARSKIGLSAEAEELYLTKLEQFIKENCNGENRLNANKSTENSRVILALTALGHSPERFVGKNLLAGLSDMGYVKKQGINGLVWALLAFDSKKYEIPSLEGEGSQTTREGLIAEIISRQLPDGGFALAGETADADITGMVLQALAPYCETREDVQLAVDKALACLSGKQLENGGYASRGEENIESDAQVLAALSALKINCRTDVRFMKNGTTLLDAILKFAQKDGAFSHTAGGSGTDLMATEQAYYALTAYYRLLEGKKSLYDMEDIEETFRMGDANGDGRISIEDAIAILRNIARIEQKIFIKDAADCNGKEGITIEDAVAVLKYTAKIIDKFPAEAGK